MTGTVKKAGRNYGIDLLRILSMFFVVNLHVLGQGGAMTRIVGAPETYYAAWLLETCAYCAVDLYGLISGYVGVESKYRPARLLELWLQVFFYSAGITLLFWLESPGFLTENSLWKAVFPVSWKTYWYFSAYVGVFVLMPYLNRMILGLSQKERKQLMIVLFLLFSVGTAWPKVNKIDFFSLEGGYSFAWLLILYLFGACIKTCSFQRRKKRWYLRWYVRLVLFSWLFKIIVENITREIYGEARFGRLFTGYVTPTIFLSAVCLLLLFETMEIRNETVKKAITRVSPMAFSVYLIHTHPQIWVHGMKGAFSWCCYLPPWGILPVVLGISAGIYLGCSLMDLGRVWIFRKLNIRMWTERAADAVLRIGKER